MSEYRKRVFVIIASGLGIIALVSVIFIAPSYLSAHSRYEDMSAQKDELDKRIAASEGLTSSESISDIIADINVLGAYNLKEYPIEAMQYVTLKKPAGVVILNFSYTPSSDSAPTIDITGTAGTRIDLSNFVSVLRSDNAFSTVDVPIEDFAKEKDISFTMKIILAEPAAPMIQHLFDPITLGQSAISTSSTAAFLNATSTSSSSSRSSKVSNTKH